MIWVIGGTSDAHKIVDLLLAAQYKVLVTITTLYGRELAEKEGVVLIQKMLTLNDMSELLKDYQVQCTIDASHPFASEVSANAIQACSLQNVRYLRFERESVEIKNASYYNSYVQMAKNLQSAKGNILLTIGSKNIKEFKHIDNERLVARVLPVKDSIAQCEDAGLKAHQIIAMKGRMEKALNKAIMEEYNISHLVTKDSGDAGGINEKVEAALDLGIQVHVLKRPSLNYPVCYSNYTELVNNLKLND